MALLQNHIHISEQDVMIGRNDLCYCGSGKKWKRCHFPMVPQGNMQDSFQALRQEYQSRWGIILKTQEQIDGIRKSGQLAARILDAVAAKAQPGVTTLELDKYAHKLYLDAGSIPATLGYGHPPYTKTICTSINEVICHGIPDHTQLKEGDIINIDVTCILNGYYGDCSRMVVVGGKTTPERQLVVDTAYECLMRSVAILKPGVLISRIGEEIEKYAHSKKCSVVDQFVAHGVGIKFHEPPQIPHYKNSIHIPLAPGMTFTIEPMINAGRKEAVIDPKDEWTARTIDNKPSAQWEHTVVITENGYEILTPWKR